MGLAAQTQGESEGIEVMGPAFSGSGENCAAVVICISENSFSGAKVVIFCVSGKELGSYLFREGESRT